MKAQVSMEYMMLAAVTALLVISTAYFMLSSSKSEQAKIADAQINKIGNDITNNAEKIYFQGAPSRLTIKEQFPEGITGIIINYDSANKNYELVFKSLLNGKSVEYSFPSKINLTGVFVPAAYQQGAKSILLQVSDDGPLHVEIKIK